MVVGAAIAAAALLAADASNGTAASADFVCRAAPITHKAPNAWMYELSRNWVHVGTLWMGYTLPDDGFIADPDGQKIALWREKGSAFGKLRVSGSRLDADAPPLRTYIPSGYATKVGFQASGLSFPTPGCWRIVAHVGLTQRYEFVVNVIARS